MRAQLLLALSLSVHVFGAKVSVSPVQKVVQLIDDFRAKVVDEGKAAENDFAEYAKWCDDEASAKDRAIKDSQEEISDLEATIADCEGTITGLESKIGEVTTTIAATEKEFDTAKGNRNNGHKTFQAAETELSDTVSTLGHDIQLIKKEMGGASFAQLSEAKKSNMQKALGGLKTLVESAWVTTQQKSDIKAFLQQKAQSQEDDEDTQEPAAYESKSGGILDTIGDMEEKAEGSLGAEQKQEMKDLNDYALLKMAFENELKNLKSELAGATSQKQTTAQELAAAKKSIGAAQKSLGSDQSYLRDLKHECQAKATEFEVEYKDRATEVAVLGKAKGILTEKFSFIQTSATVRVASHMRMTDDRKEKALKLIQHLGKSLGSTVLISLSYRALADPFAKVKGMVEEMIEKLLQEAAEEAEGKAFCDKEQGETNAGIADKGEKLNKVGSRIEKAEATVEKLSEEVSILTQELAENDAAIADATKIRGDEKSAFTVAAKDYAESQEACAAAIEVLRNYYESGAAFVQMQMKTQTKAKSSEEESTGDGSAIIGLLEVAESDFSKLLSEAKAAEDAAAEEFDKMTNDSRVLKATKSAEVKGKKTQIASIKSGLMDFSSDKDGLTKELGALQAYMDKLKPQCTVQVPSYEERKQRREKEIDGLKEALAVLEGDSIA